LSIKRMKNKIILRPGTVEEKRNLKKSKDKLLFLQGLGIKPFTIIWEVISPKSLTLRKT